MRCWSCGGRCRAQPLPKQIVDSENLTRFLFDRRHIYAATKKPKQKAFYPAEYQKQLETSVARLDKASAARVAHLGDTIRFPEKAVAITTVPVAAVKEARLSVHYASELCFSEHAVIRGWPTGGDPKAAYMQAASILAYHATKAVQRSE